MNLPFDTCIRLRDMGFPQLGNGNALVLNFPIPESDQTVTAIPWALYVHNPMPTREVVYEPTLEELIDFCGGDFVRLRRSGSLWETWGYFLNDAHYCHALTHKEAVANLCIALNENKKLND